MANIRIVVDGPLQDGHKLTFKAPCDCSEMEYLDVRHLKNNEQVSTLFTMKDAGCGNLTTTHNLFSKDSYVSVVLDTKNNRAFLQNANTNQYLENKIGQMSNPNLLINGDFRVWQRGVKTTNYDGEFFADCWFIDAGLSFTLEKTSNGFSFSGITTNPLCFTQRIEALLENKPYTLQISIDGEVHTISIPNLGANWDNFSISDKDSNVKASLYHRQNTHTSLYISTGKLSGVINWVKLEAGEVATPFVPKHYGEELLMCQRYLYILPYSQYVASVDSSSRFYIHNDWVLNNMREGRRIQFDCGVFVYQNGTQKRRDSLSNLEFKYGAISFIPSTGADFTPGVVYLYPTDESARFIISSEIL